VGARRSMTQLSSKLEITDRIVDLGSHVIHVSQIVSIESQRRSLFASIGGYVLVLAGLGVMGFAAYSVAEPLISGMGSFSQFNLAAWAIGLGLPGLALTMVGRHLASGHSNAVIVLTSEGGRITIPTRHADTREALAKSLANAMASLPFSYHVSIDLEDGSVVDHSEVLSANPLAVGHSKTPALGHAAAASTVTRDQDDIGSRVGQGEPAESGQTARAATGDISADPGTQDADFLGTADDGSHDAAPVTIEQTAPGQTAPNLIAPDVPTLGNGIERLSAPTQTTKIEPSGRPPLTANAGSRAPASDQEPDAAPQSPAAPVITRPNLADRLAERGAGLVPGGTISAGRSDGTQRRLMPTFTTLPTASQAAGGDPSSTIASDLAQPAAPTAVSGGVERGAAELTTDPIDITAPLAPPEAELSAADEPGARDHNALELRSSPENELSAVTAPSFDASQDPAPQGDQSWTLDPFAASGAAGEANGDPAQISDSSLSVPSAANEREIKAADVDGQKGGGAWPTTPTTAGVTSAFETAQAHLNPHSDRRLSGLRQLDDMMARLSAAEAPYLEQLLSMVMTVRGFLDGNHASSSDAREQWAAFEQYAREWLIEVDGLIPLINDFDAQLLNDEAA